MHEIRSGSWGIILQFIDLTLELKNLEAGGVSASLLESTSGKTLHMDCPNCRHSKI
jgi:hypothetical protein